MNASIHEFNERQKDFLVASRAVTRLKLQQVLESNSDEHRDIMETLETNLHIMRMQGQKIYNLACDIVEKEESFDGLIDDAEIRNLLVAFHLQCPREPISAFLAFVAGDSLDYLQDAAAQRFAPAQFRMSMYSNCITESLIQLKRAADQGYPPAVCIMGHSGVIETLCRYRRHLAGANQGLSHSQFCLAIILEQGDNPQYEWANKWYEKAARSGNVHAQFNLGYNWQHGIGVPRRCVEEACKWYRRAIEIGCDKSMINLARLLAQRGDAESCADLAKRADSMGLTRVSRIVGNLARQWELSQEGKDKGKDECKDEGKDEEDKQGEDKQGALLDRKSQKSRSNRRTRRRRKIRINKQIVD